jgi:hypothetical protein
MLVINYHYCLHITSQKSAVESWNHAACHKNYISISCSKNSKNCVFQVGKWFNLKIRFIRFVVM